jgi:hypothetical protein
MKRRRFRYVVPLALALSLAGASLALAGSGGKGGKGPHGQSSTFFASLNGHQEAPAIHTKGTGQLKLTMTDPNTFSYELTFSGLSGNATLAHIHFAQPNVSGGVIVDLCGGTKPACPAAQSGTVTGTFTGTDVKAVQGFAAGDFAGFVDELRAGFMYANVHTTAVGSGEIRGQIFGDRGKHHGFGRGHGHDD